MDRTTERMIEKFHGPNGTPRQITMADMRKVLSWKDDDWRKIQECGEEAERKSQEYLDNEYRGERRQRAATRLAGFAKEAAGGSQSNTRDRVESGFKRIMVVR